MRIRLAHRQRAWHRVRYRAWVLDHPAGPASGEVENGSSLLHSENVGGLATRAPLVDVIIPTNRVSPFLAEALKSLSSQTWSNWRLTIVDDGSPDPVALAEATSGIPNAQLIRNPGEGVSAARTAGVRATRGQYLVFLDDDDLWEEDRLELQVLDLQTNPGHVAAFCAGRYIDSHGREFGVPWPAVSCAARVFLAGNAPLPRIVTMMVKREAFMLVGGFDETLRMAEDLDLTLRLLQVGEFAANPSILVLYRRHSQNVSKGGSLTGRRAIRGLLRKQVTEAEQRGDASAAVLLRHNQRLSRAAASREAVDACLGAARNGKWGYVIVELGWSLRSPVAAFKHTARKLAVRPGRPGMGL